jgi:hypothetical protein
MSIFTSKKVWNFLIKTADKIWSKKDKGWKVSSLMPIRINWLDVCTFFAECNNALPWDKLIDPTGFPQQTVTTSKEEQLMNERKRCNPWGISGYQLCPKTGRVIFQVNGIQDWNFRSLICSYKLKSAKVFKIGCSLIFHQNRYFSTVFR